MCVYANTPPYSGVRFQFCIVLILEQQNSNDTYFCFLSTVIVRWPFMDISITILLNISDSLSLYTGVQYILSIRSQIFVVVVVSSLEIYFVIWVP